MVIKAINYGRTKMIKVYLAAIPSLYEGEDIEVRYSLVQGDTVLNQESIVLEYAKPLLVGMISITTVLRKIQRYKEEELVIFINDATLYGIIEDRNTTKNLKVTRMGQKMREKITKFKDLSFVNVAKDQELLHQWEAMTVASI